MNKRPIIKPEVHDTFFYGKIISWNFREGVTYVKQRKRYCFRFELIFESGKTKHMQKGGFHTKTEAIKARENTITQLYERSYIPFEYTVKEFFDYWLYYYMIDEKEISYSTFMGYRNIVYNYTITDLGNKKMTVIQKDDIINIFHKISHKSTLKIAYTVMRSSFQYAEQNGIIHINPAKSAVKIKKKAEQNKKRTRKSNSSNPIKKPPCVYSLQQVSIMLYVCKKEEPKIFMALLLALTAGLRISEIIGVKYEDIDFVHHELYIERQLGRSIFNEGMEDGTMTTQELRPKTHNSIRTVPLASFVIDEIILQRKKYEELRDNFSDFQDHGYLCCQDNGSPYNRSFTRNSYTRLMQKCGFERIPWRKLRNTYATILAEYDVSMKAIAASLGHYSPEFTESTYVSLNFMESAHASLNKIIYDADKEITVFAHEVLPGEKEIEIIPIDERYLLEVLP